jgi:ketosteroid isomerase-like protein
MNETEMQEAVERALVAWNANDWEAMSKEYCPDAHVRPPQGWVEGADARVGWEQIQRQFARLKDSWRDEHLEPAETLPAGDSLFVHFRWLMEGETSGIKVETDVFCAFRFEGDCITFQSFHFDRAGALADAGIEDTG